MIAAARFEKVSLKQFSEACKRLHPDADPEKIRQIYEGIPLPQRATAGSAGYDFCAPEGIRIRAGEEILIPTGIRAKIEAGYVLMLFPRSSLGFRYRLQLDNTVGIIDSDYYHADNEGHILVKLINDSRENKDVEISCGDRFVQGIFLPFALTYDDSAEGERTGGFGSTNKD